MRKYYFFLLVVCIVAASCIKKDDFNFNKIKIDEWNSEWALPLINSKLTLKNLVQHASTGNILSEDSTGLYSIHYDGKVFEASASDYIKIQDQNFSTDTIPLSSPISVSNFNGSVSDTFSSFYNYTDTSGAQLKHLRLKSGNIKLKITSSFQQNLSAQIVFPTVKNGATVLSVNAQVNYPSTSTTVNINLSGYTFDFTNNNTTNNYLPYKVYYTITGNGTQPINTTDFVIGAIDLTNLQFAFVDGYLGQRNIPIPLDTIAIEVFNNTLSAQLFLENPKIHLNVKNYFGISASGALSNAHGIVRNGSINNILGTFFSTSLVIAQPTVVGQMADNNYTMDKNNSNIQNVFNPAPNKIVYQGNIQINPTGVAYNFITDTSKIIVWAHAEIPAWFKIIDFTLQDTFNLTLPDNPDLLQSIQFKMNVENAFPLYTNVQIYFADSLHKTLDSLVVPNQFILAEAPVDANGIVKGSTSKETTFDMDNTRYRRINTKVKYAIIKGNLKTSSSHSVQIHSSDYIALRLVTDAKLKISKLK
ncbi:MAG: hypothetical protein RL708_1212 [Bacteroidota bacterium]|jgi:hypothetical protein